MQQDWERRHPHLDVEFETLAALLAAAIPGHPLLAAEPLSGGLANTNYRATLDGMAAPVVLRLFTREPAACRKEADLYPLVRDAVPVPELLYAAPDATPPYAVTGWVVGAKLDALLADPHLDDLRGLARAVGAALAPIGRVTFPHAGFFGPGLIIAEPLPSMRETCVGYVEELLFQRGAATSLGPDLSERIWRLLRDNAALLDELDPTPRLTHADYKAQNLLMRRDPATGAWTVAAVLDWEFALAATPLLDLAILLRYAGRLPSDFERGVTEGFSGAGGELPAHWKPITKLLDLMNLCDFLARPDPGARMVADVRALLASTAERWPFADT